MGRRLFQIVSVCICVSEIIKWIPLLLVLLWGVRMCDVLCHLASVTSRKFLFLLFYVPFLRIFFLFLFAIAIFFFIETAADG